MWIDFLDENALNFGDKCAIIDQKNNLNLTYRELLNEVNKWACALKKRKIKKDSVLAYLAPHNTLEHLTLMLACAKLQALFVPLNFRLSTFEIDAVLKKIDPTLFLIDGGFKLASPSDFSKAFEICDKEKIFHHILESEVCALERNDYSRMDQTILMLFTSGSTGVPKGVMFHGEMLESNMLETAKNWGLLETDCTLVETPFFHTGGYNVLLLPLLKIGGTAILASQFNATNVLETIARNKVSVYFGVPTMFQMLLECDKFKQTDFTSIRFFISGGAACPVSLIKEYQKRGLVFKQGFGLTEVGPNCFLLDEKYALSKAGSIGKPMPHSEVLVLDENLNRVGVDVPGELLIKGPHLFNGYYKNEEIFKQSLLNGYFRTGDLVKYDSEGFYYVVGRLKDMYISGGENVYPGEVEKQLTSHLEIAEACVVAVKHDKWGEVGYAFLKTEAQLNVDDVRHFLQSKLSRYKHPHFVRCVKDFPLLPNGKIDRSTLKKIAESSHATM